MVVAISSKGYIKRTPSSIYRTQNRGGKGLKGARVEEEDPIQHLFVASTHDYLLFFTNLGRVYWRKVYDLPELSRESRGKAIVNLLNLSEGETIADCRPVRDFSGEQFLVMATAAGIVKKTPLEAYGRPQKAGIIAIKLREGDQLVDVAVTRPGDEVILSTAGGMAIRFKQSDARPMGRNSTGVKGINLMGDDQVVGMVVANPDAALLTVCANGYGKRTPFGPNVPGTGEEEELAEDAAPPPNAPEAVPDEAPETDDENGDEEGHSSSRSYRTQRRGGKGLRDIKTTDRNGPVIGITAVSDDDELLMITARGKIQRVRACEISVVGRNTQGVRIMTLDDDDRLVAVRRVPREENGDESQEGAPKPSEPSSGE